MTQSLETDLKGQQVRLDAVSSVLLELLHQLGGLCKGLWCGRQLLAIWVGILLPVHPGFCYSHTRVKQQQQQQQQQQQHHTHRVCQGIAAAAAHTSGLSRFSSSSTYIRFVKVQQQQHIHQVCQGTAAAAAAAHTSGLSRYSSSSSSSSTYIRFVKV